ncbi:unnamed protein product [Caenorhabditis brenneri]
MNLRPHKTKSYDHRKVEDADFSKYIAEQCEKAQQPIQVYSRLCQDFVQITGCSLSVDSLKNRFLKFREGVAANTTLSHNTKVKQLFALGVSLDPGLLRQLQSNATVIVDDKNRITKYVSKSKELKLEGNHGNRDSGGRLKRSDTASSSRNGEEELDPRAPAPKKAKTRESSTAIRANPAATPNSVPKNQKNPPPGTPKTAPNPPVKIPENPAQQTQRIEVINLDDDEEEEDVKPVIHQMNLSLNQDEERIKVENPEEHVEPLRECMPLDAQKVYLKYTQNLMTAMKVPADEKLSKKMQTKIEEIERLQMLGLEQEDKVKFDVFGNIVISGINLAKMNLEPLEDSRSLREFTLLLKMNILHLGLPELAWLEGVMDTFLEEPGNQNMRVSISRIGMVVGMIVDILMA